MVWNTLPLWLWQILMSTKKVRLCWKLCHCAFIVTENHLDFVKADFSQPPGCVQHKRQWKWGLFAFNENIRIYNWIVFCIGLFNISSKEYMFIYKIRPLLFRCTTSLPRDHFTLSNSLTLPLKSKQRPRLPTKLVVIYSERSSFNLKIIAELNPFFVLLQFVALKNEDPQNQLCIKFKTLMTPSKIGRMQVRTKSRI